MSRSTAAPPPRLLTVTQAAEHLAITAQAYGFNGCDVGVVLGDGR